MKRCESLCLALLYLLFLLSLPMQAQVPSSVLLIFAGSGPVFVADFNGDGKPDLLTADGTMNLGNGDGTFSAGTKVTLPAGWIWAVADFNGDGKLDLLEQSTATLLLLLGNGDGTFQTTPISTAIPGGLGGVNAVDLNGDGKADVVGISGTNVLVYLGNGDGTFASGVSYNLGTSGLLSLGDFNGDGKTDVVVTPGGALSTRGQEIVLLGNGDGTFQPAQTSVGGIGAAYYAVAGDMNGDGKADLAVNGCDYVYGCNVWVSLSNGDGTFPAPGSFGGTPPEFGTGALAGGDLNRDGKMDLIWGQTDIASNPSAAEIYLSNGDGSFSNTSSYFLNPTTSSTPSTGGGVADFNGDGNPDVAFGNTVLLGNGDGTFRGIECACPPGLVAGLEFALAPGSSFSQTVSAGQTAKFDLSVLAAPPFSGTVILSCAITPVVSPAPSCSLSSTSVQIAGGTQPVSVPVIVNVATTAPTNAGGETPVIHPPGGEPLIWVGMLLGSCWLWVRIRKRVRAFVAPATVLLLTSVLSCGGSGAPHGSPGTPAGTYTATITASGSGVNYNLPFTVVVR